jgi:hypothetical protein
LAEIIGAAAYAEDQDTFAAIDKFNNWRGVVHGEHDGTVESDVLLLQNAGQAGERT